MADVVNNTGVLEATSHSQLNGNASVVTEIMSSTDTIHEQRQEENTDEDILQQALVEASESYPCSAPIQYGPESIPLTEGTLITTDEEEVKFLTSNGQVTAVQLTEGFENGNIDIIPEVQSETNEPSYETEPNAEQLQVTNENGLEFVMQEEGENLIKEDQTNITQVIDPGGGEQKTENVNQPQTIFIQQSHGPAPLGSSQNPIRIIQQGNQYTPVQQLTTDQLQQIMQVVQQQQVASKSVDTGSSVLFNPQTNTRIVYRVIYPSELHKEDPANKQNTTMQTTPKKIYKKRIKDEEMDKIDGPELSKEEKESRKKMRAKTRSGRISKPPKHMVKDFKHIHVLDYDEDYDDSDGGYSDYKVEDEDDDRDGTKQDDDGNLISHGLHSMRPKNWKCITCDKAYIGRAGLSRHLKLYPSHGTLEPDSEEMEPAAQSEQTTPGSQPDDSTTASGNDASSTSNELPTTPNDTTPTTLPATPNGLNSTTNSTASFSEDSRDSSYSLPYTPVSRPNTRGTGQRGRPRGSRRGWRGRGNYYRGDPETRRRNRLKELMKECSDEELMEVVLPRLAKVITLWEFLLMKVEKGDPAWPHADDIFREYEKLHQHVRKLCQEYLLHVPEVTEKETGVRMIQVTDSGIATGLGLKLGHHKVTDIPHGSTDLKYKHKPITAANHVSSENSRTAVKRTLEVVSPEPVASPAKKPKLVSLKQTVTLAPVQNNSVPIATAVPSSSVTNSGDLLNHTASHSPVLVQGPSMSEPQLQLISAPGTVNRTIASPVVAGKSSHSGRTKSLVKLSPPSTSSQTKQTSQKFIIISGTDANNTSTNTKINAKVPSRNMGVPGTVQIRNNIDTGTRHILPAPTPPASQMNQIITISNDQNEISQLNSLQSATNVSLTSQQQVLPINALSNQQFIVVSQSSQGQTIDEKLLIGSAGDLKHVPVQNLIYTTSQAQAPGSAEVLSNNAVLTPVVVGSDTRFLTTGVNSCDAGEVIKFETGDAQQNVVYTFQNGNDGLITGSSAESMDTSQNSVLYSIGSSGMVSLLKPEPNPADMGSVGSTVTHTGSSTQVILSNDNANEVVGVINSIDNAELQHVKLDPSDPQLDVDSHAADIHADVTNTNVSAADGKSDSLQVNNSLEENMSTGEEANTSSDLDTNDGNTDSAVSYELSKEVVNDAMQVDSDALMDQSRMAAEVNGSGDVVLSNNENSSVIVSVAGDASLIADKGEVASADDTCSENVPVDVVENEGTSVIVKETEECSGETTGQVEGGEAGETVQVPAINIFQTEEGVIFIQNPDGTTLQLQSPDGQNISMETVQALLAMDGETQFITEQTAVENQ